MTPDEQLRLWVAGESHHNKERDECCPDFSCCRPGTLAPKEEREHFSAADEIERTRMLGMFLGRAIQDYTDKKVHITAPDRAVEEGGDGGDD